jgi:hypothetical protein
MPVALVGLLATALCTPSAALSCRESSVARDYLAQVKKAAPIREVPPLGSPMSRQLPFSPPGLRLQVIDDGLIVGSSQVGFSLSSPAKTQRDLHWIVEGELFKVNARGRIIRSHGIKRRRIGSLQDDAEINLVHQVSSATPAYYRTDIRIFHKGSDRILGLYSSYARVMKPRVDLRLRINSFTVAPGEYAEATLLNLGTVPLISLSYDFGFRVQAFTGESWVRVPRNPPPRAPKRRGPWGLWPGSFTCLLYRVPSDQAPGALFRFVLFGGDTQLTAEFLVAPNS